MAKLDPIWNRARSDLIIATEHGETDVFLWEHSVRIAHSAQRIAELPEIQEDSPDESAIVAAALYHDSGWIVRLLDGEIKRQDILLRQTPDAHREQGAAFMLRSLAELLPAPSLDLAATAIRTLNDRDIPILEGRIVTEAENLDDFGVLSLWPAVRRGALEGKGVKAVIDTWRRRKEYQFWTARLKDAFWFPAVRKIAEARLAGFERFLEELDSQQQGKDIDSVSPVESAR
ncbi:MAG: HD domain-containing protein [Planctomycetota bacterium]